MKKFILNKSEKQWVSYDVGNSAFTLLITTIMPIYFNSLAQKDGMSAVDYLAYWGYAASVTTLIVAFLGPILGTFSDLPKMRKKIFVGTLVVGVIGCLSLGIMPGWFMFLVVFVIAKVGYSASLVVYDSMLSDITKNDRMDIVSSYGYAYGYIGSCVPFVISLLLVLGGSKIGISTGLAMNLAFWVTALWWVGFSLPLIKNYQQIYFVKPKAHPVKDSFVRLGHTFKDIAKNKHVFVFLLAFFFYIDGVYTIIAMSVAYGQALGLSSTGLLLALLVTQIVAFPSALLLGRLTHKFQASRILGITILAYLGIAIFAVQLNHQWEFWFLAVMVGLFQGTIQALSRSYYAKIIPPEKSGEYFGIYDICGKGASFLGTALMGFVGQMTGNISLGVVVIVVMFVIGFIFFRKATQLNEVYESNERQV